MNRKFADHFFKYLVSTVALFSVLALGAIVMFVFFQGTRTFFTSTASGIRLVPQRINDITVNGERYLNHSGFIYLPDGTSYVRINFPLADEEETFYFVFDASERNPELAVRFVRDGEELLHDDFQRSFAGSITYPEAYVFTIEWPAAIAAMQPRLHIILPEPPYSFLSFLTGTRWQPTIFKTYGILPMIVATIIVAFGAILIGVPLALLCAVFMSEFLPARFASIVRSGIELLAGIPSVVYGFFGLMVIVPMVRQIFDIPAGNTLLSATIVLSLMILPTVTIIAETSLRAVPRSVREASLALGASRIQTAWRVVLPHANSGIIAGIILGMSRAVGETMAVILVAGNSPQLVINPLESARTLTATIALEMGYAAGRHSEMLFSIGVVLFSMILILNSIILCLRRRMEAA
ncbi:MAG: phosphate ABC transporter permease subunit PstC [Treponema sp.]|nr:phosphate ABC transporter permease subunit PstC [Treponema sp.]